MVFRGIFYHVLDFQKTCRAFGTPCAHQRIDLQCICSGRGNGVSVEWHLLKPLFRRTLRSFLKGFDRPSTPLSKCHSTLTRIPHKAKPPSARAEQPITAPSLWCKNSTISRFCRLGQERACRDAPRGGRDGGEPLCGSQVSGLWHRRHQERCAVLGIGKGRKCHALTQARRLQGIGSC
jgi:hypothetical protein